MVYGLLKVKVPGAVCGAAADDGPVRRDGSRISISGSGLGCLLSSGHKAHVLSPPVTGSSLFNLTVASSLSCRGFGTTILSYCLLY
ncbi:hypothetical protein Hamer_G011391 [Homarus americanus]|uniref:Uncharacterized protein n=1 Tax=Homarus americanus TaxID=6706 RepID=A0A8J5MPJ2_HOMAM|nr:hypothetical protein Hamer_G011391 [Homarus americanus]